MGNPFEAPRASLAPPLDAPRRPLRPWRGWMAAVPLFVPIGWPLVQVIVGSWHLRIVPNSPMSEPLDFTRSMGVAVALAEVLAFVVLNPLVARGLRPARMRSSGAFLLRMTLVVAPLTAAAWLASALWFALQTRAGTGGMGPAGQSLAACLLCVAGAEVAVLPVSWLWFVVARPRAAPGG